MIDIANTYNQLGLMALPLTLSSVAVITIILERMVFFLNKKLLSRRDHNKLKSVLSGYQQQPKKIRDEFISIELHKLKIDYYKGLKLLRVIGTIAPLLGLLGTVLGIISAFKVIATHTTYVSPNMVAGGLWEAMLTTAIGLLIAIPALLSAHFFTYVANNKLQNLELKFSKNSLQIEMKK